MTTDLMIRQKNKKNKKNKKTKLDTFIRVVSYIKKL